MDVAYRLNQAEKSCNSSWNKIGASFLRSHKLVLNLSLQLAWNWKVCRDQKVMKVSKCMALCTIELLKTCFTDIGFSMFFHWRLHQCSLAFLATLARQWKKRRRGSRSFSLLPALSLVSRCNLQLWKTPVALKRNVSRFLEGNWFQQADKQMTFYTFFLSFLDVWGMPCHALMGLPWLFPQQIMHTHFAISEGCAT